MTSSTVTNELIMERLNLISQQINDQISEVKDFVSPFRQEIDHLKELLAEYDDKFLALTKRVEQLERNHRFIEEKNNRYLVRFYNFPAINEPYHLIKIEVIKILESVGISSSSISEIRQIRMMGKTRAGKEKSSYIELTLSSVDAVNKLCQNSFNIYKYQEKKIQVSRVLSQHQLSDMYKSINNAKAMNQDGKVKIKWSIPAAFVGTDSQGKDNQVWPVRRSATQCGRPYATAAKLMNFFKDVPLGEIRSFPKDRSPICSTIPDDSGHKFAGIILSWDGQRDHKKSVENAISSLQLPFKLEKSDNIIYAAVTKKKGKIELFSSHGKEPGADDQLFRILENRRIADVIVVIIRKYSGIRMGADRYLKFDEMANKLLDQS